MAKQKWMRLTLLLVSIAVLGACGNKPTETVEPTATATVASEPTTEISIPDPAEPLVITSPEVAGVCEAVPLPELPVRPVDDTDWSKGADEEDAEFTIFEYSDFQCPGCGGMYPVLTQFLEDHPNVRLVYRHFPLDFHQYAMVTSEAAEAAGEQGKFWEMHNLLFDTAADWSILSEEDLVTQLIDYAEELELDVARFAEELEAGTYREKIQAQYDEARELGLGGTPTFLFNNFIYPSDIGLYYGGMESFLNILNNQDKFFFDAPPEVVVAEDDVYQATLKTTKGDLLVDLYPESAPLHVNSFVHLAQESWYDGANFFFVQDDFVAVTGDPTNTTIGYPGYQCKGEERLVVNKPGLVWSLGNGQFFITLGELAYQRMVADAQSQGEEPAQFALIGEVVEGMEVLDLLTRLSVGDPVAPDVLLQVEVTKK